MLENRIFLSLSLSEKLINKSTWTYQQESLISRPSMMCGRMRLSLLIRSIVWKAASTRWMPYCSRMAPQVLVWAWAVRIGERLEREDWREKIGKRRLNVCIRSVANFKAVLSLENLEIEREKGKSKLPGPGAWWTGNRAPSTRSPGTAPTALLYWFLIAPPLSRPFKSSSNLSQRRVVRCGLRDRFADAARSLIDKWMPLSRACARPSCAPTNATTVKLTKIKHCSVAK